jgi:predicted peroxiredoxin
MQAFVANGGQIWACGACAKPRGITEADMVNGAKIVSAASVVEWLASGASSLSF